jgi:lambda repressor-like predicted transcriptional regulator
MVIRVAKGSARSKLIEKTISDHLGSSPEKLWPSNFKPEDLKVRHLKTQRIKSSEEYKDDTYRARFKAILLLRNTSLLSFSKGIGRTQRNVYDVLHGHCRSTIIEEHICSVIGEDRNDIFPIRRVEYKGSPSEGIDGLKIKSYTPLVMMLAATLALKGSAISEFVNENGFTKGDILDVLYKNVSNPEIEKAISDVLGLSDTFGLLPSNEN